MFGIPIETLIERSAKMKRILSIMLAFTVIISTLTTAFAESNQKTTGDKGIVNFERYLSQLHPEHAAIIRNDPELVSMMKRDSYWEPQSKPKKHANVSLPLQEYPSGSFFTINGKACTCHSVSENKCGIRSTSCVKNGISGNCKVHNESIQCKGFADYVFETCTGIECKHYNAVDADTIPFYFGNNILGQDELSDFMRGLPAGSNLRMSNRSGGSHSFIMVEATRTGITLYDCNGTSTPCKVRTVERTWKELVTTYKGVTAVWAA